MNRITHIYTVIRHIVMAVIMLIPAQSALAFDTSLYTETSVLASGRWVKISVSESGLHMIPTQTLRSWGFSDPSRVRIYGYGGRRISNLLSASGFRDDLEQIPVALTDRGVVFYAAGPDEWVRSVNNRYHLESNQYSLYGYYFLTEGDEDATIRTRDSEASDTDIPQINVQGRLHYEKERVRVSEAGCLMVGEDFMYNQSQTFKFATPGVINNASEAWFECQFVTKSVGATSQLSFTANGADVPAVSADRISATANSHYVHATLATTRHSLLLKEDNLDIEVKFTPSGVTSLAYLDYISVNYNRRLALDDKGYLPFWANSSVLTFMQAPEDLRIWDVTDATAPFEIKYSVIDGDATWRTPSTGWRDYVAWTPAATLPAPQFVSEVPNQNLHAPIPEGTDMVIFTTTPLAEQAQRIASLHETYDGLHVTIANVEEVYNEFSSGTPDISALRKYLKMIYDRGKDTPRPLKYALLLGRTTLDHRQILATTKALNYTTMPSYVTREARASMSDNDGYTTDDFIAILGDNTGNDLGLDDLSIAVGRIPMTSAEDGKDIVDKLYNYVTSSKRDAWKNRILVVADDEDQGVHLLQADAMADGFLSTEGQQHIVNKVYLDAYIKSSGIYPDARRDMFRALDEGTLWWTFTGHANNHSWTGEGQLTFTDINSLYLRRLPFLLAATCDFLRWDSETTSGGEIMYKEDNGGVIGMISATRPVYITDNGYFLNSIGRHLLERDENGHLLTPGEIYRRSKNDILNSRGEHKSNTNRLRFVLMGDPAMRLASPDNVVKLLTINGKEVDPDAQITISALENVTITGCVTDPFGALIPDFNGTISIDLYDAERSITTLGNGEGKQLPFDTHGDKLFTGASKITDGNFTMNIPMPSMVDDNFRPATLSMYAAADNSTAEAIGVNRDFYIYGYSEPETADTIAPEIEFFVLNHQGFKQGDCVNSEPMAIAKVSDNIGINLSNSGVGYQMTLTLDGKTTYSDVSSYYTPLTDGTPGGTINYPLENISDGAHTIRLRVFDTSGNATSEDIEFFVDSDVAPKIFDVFTDAMPAIDKASFYVRHDRPENILSVSVTVYTLMGQPIWTGSATGVSDNDLSAPVVWDLTDSVGRRVNRGIYLYRASVTTDNAHYVTASRRIAVAAE